MSVSGRRDRLRLVETYRNLFYAPIYVALAGGFLYQEGLDVQFSTAPAGQSAVGMLRDGSADVVQTGLSRSLMELDQGRDDAPLHVAEINQRDGFFLVSRHSTANWSWRDLEDAALIPVGFSPVPWMSLKAALGVNGVNIEKVKLMEGLSAQDAMERFRAGEADYIHMPNPQAQQLIQDAEGHFAAAVGPVLGPLCFSSFAVTPGYLDARPDVIGQFVRGFYNAQMWLATAEVTAVVANVAPFFPGTSEVVLEHSIQRYKSQDTWAQDPLIGEDGFAALRDVLIDGGLVRGRHPYERLVRPEFAAEAMKA